MESIWKFAPEQGKERRLLTLLVLHLLEKRPESGYGLLKEIGITTGGSWIPNKGSLYPLLKNLEQEGLIKERESGKRSKRVFELTAAGEQVLESIKGKKQESEQRVEFFKHMHFELFGEKNSQHIDLLMDIRFFVEDLPEIKKEQAKEILTAAFCEIKKL